MENTPIEKKRGRPPKKSKQNPSEEKIDVALMTSPIRKNFSKIMKNDLPLVDHLGVPHSSMLGLNPENHSDEEESAMPYGSEELRERTREYAPRSRLNNSREMQFRSREERVEYYSRQVDTETLGKTYLSEELINDRDNFYMWIRKSVRDRYDGNNMRNMERLGWIFTSADKSPSMAYFDYDGDLNDSETTIEGGGLILGELDILIHQRRMQKQSQLRNDQARLENLMLQQPGENVAPISPYTQNQPMYPQMAPGYGIPQHQAPLHPVYPAENMPSSFEPVYRTPQQPLQNAVPMPLPNDGEPLYRQGAVSYPSNPGDRY